MRLQHQNAFLTTFLVVLIGLKLTLVYSTSQANVEEENTNDNRYNISYGVENLEISSSDIISKIEIFDLMGSSLFSLSDIDNYEYTVNTASLMKGLYILRVDNISYKFLKR